MSLPPTSSIFIINSSPVPGSATQYNGKIIIASLAMLFFVVLFILALHIYVKWFWQRSLRRQQASMWQRRQHGFHIDGEGLDTMTSGLDKAIVDSMPTFLYKVTDNEALECAVCLSEFQENEKGRLLPKCNHRFHIDCIDMWFLSHSTCPLCRTCAEPVHPVVSTMQELELAVSSLSDGLTVRQQPGYGGPPEYAMDGAEQGTSDHVDGESLPSPGWRWRRSTSDGYTQNPRAGVQFPTNVLFWGNNSHVSSHASSSQVVAPPPWEHGQRGGRSLSHMTIDIPRRAMHIPRSSSSGAAMQACCASDQQQCKLAGTGLNVFKRLLSREKRVFPMEPGMGVCSSNSSSHVVGPSSAAASMGL